MQERNYFVSKMEDVEVRSALRLEYIQDLCYWFEDNLNLVSLNQGCGNTMPDLSDLVPFHSGQVENF